MIISHVTATPENIKNLDDTTRDHTVILDTETFALAGGIPFKDRETIVVTPDTNYYAKGVTIMRSLTEALQFAALEQGKHFEEKQEETEVFIVGEKLGKEAGARIQKFY